MTIADSQLATTLAHALMHLIGQQQQQQLPNLIRWFTTCTRHPALAPYVGKSQNPLCFLYTQHCLACCRDITMHLDTVCLLLCSQGMAPQCCHVAQWGSNSINNLYKLHLSSPFFWLFMQAVMHVVEDRSFHAQHVDHCLASDCRHQPRSGCVAGGFTLCQDPIGWEVKHSQPTAPPKQQRLTDLTM